MPMPTPRPIDRVSPGCFKLKRIRGGPWVAALILYSEMPEGGYWSAVINGRASPLYAARADGQCPNDAPEVWDVWHHGREITPEDYRLMLAVKSWAEEKMPEHPAAKPGRKIDISRSDPLF
jgi:hypothetical protein